ncbi:TetR/AcrR family transcriptional regulator [Desulfurivibrio sp. C05AmB]|jgi:TetR/AcrR family transcriptional regulator, fatty acid metabolism regulator protein|uniref:TetR/AcrR family transcriptional regulator n=1 Tax=Desulfurivibrio sp. C05AmB TaxID=3374371 RepID=UPI00376EF858
MIRTADKHSKIIEAAIRVFSRKGFFHARIADIAKEAQVADGTIYLYFNNKYDILISLFEEEIGKIILEVKQLLESEAGDDPRRMLGIFALNHLKMMDDRRELAEVLHTELRQSNKFMREYRNTKFSEYLDIISGIVRKGQEMAIFRPEILPEVFEQAFFGALDETSRLWVLSPDHSYSIEETAEQITGFFLKGIIAPATQN